MDEKNLLHYVDRLEKKIVRRRNGTGVAGPSAGIDDHSRCMAYSISAPVREIRQDSLKLEKELREIYQAPVSAWSGQTSGRLPRLDMFVNLMADITYHTSLVGEMLESIDCGRWTVDTGESTSDLNAVISHWISRIRRTRSLDPDVKVIPRLKKRLPRVGMRECEAFQMVYHMITNAVESLPAGRGGQVKIKTDSSGGEVVFEVMDNGYGIREEIRDKIFSPFYTTKGYREPGEKHPGLGLYMADRIVKERGGRIEVRSEQGIGSVFSVFLPALLTGARDERKISP